MQSFNTTVGEVGGESSCITIFVSDKHQIIVILLLCFRIIAVNYEARAKGVNRHMRGDDALQACPDLNLVRVKELHGKADLSK